MTNMTCDLCKKKIGTVESVCHKTVVGNGYQTPSGERMQSNFDFCSDCIEKAAETLKRLPEATRLLLWNRKNKKK